jgi:hypothetical protein
VWMVCISMQSSLASMLPIPARSRSEFGLWLSRELVVGEGGELAFLLPLAEEEPVFVDDELDLLLLVEAMCALTH